MRNRWGFRQVEKSVPGIMIFMHTNFVRGDKQRCLKMRSIVKKQQAPPPPYPHPGMGMGMYGGPQGFPPQYGMMGGMPDMNMMAGYGYGGPQGAKGQMQMGGYPGGGFNQGGGMGGNFFTPNQYTRPGAGMGGPPSGMTSKEMFQAGLRLERMEQAQAAAARGNSMAPGSGGGGGGGGGQIPSGSQDFPALSNVPPNMRDNMSEVELASEIMKQGEPGMEPWRALELAKRFKNRDRRAAA